MTPSVDLIYFDPISISSPSYQSLAYEIKRAMAKAAAAAKPPIKAVWSPLRIIGVPVNRPLAAPKTSSVMKVTAQEIFKAR
jgi:hypothetical protein